MFLKLFNIVNGSLISAIWRNTYSYLCSLEKKVTFFQNCWSKIITLQNQNTSKDICSNIKKILCTALNTKWTCIRPGFLLLVNSSRRQKTLNLILIGSQYSCGKSYIFPLFIRNNRIIPAWGF